MRINYLKPYLVGNQLIRSIKVVADTGNFEKDEYGEEICSNPQLSDEELRHLYNKTPGKAWNSSGISPAYFLKKSSTF